MSDDTTNDTTNDDTNDTTNDTVVGQLARTRTLARTMTEVIKLRRWKEEAETVILGLQELGQTLGVPLGANVTGQDAADAAAALVAERDELRATLDRVREVHRPHACTGYPDCMILFGGACAHDGHCNHCRKTWPCPTICALDGAGEQ